MPTYPLTGSAAAEVENRLAVARLGQSRLGFMNPLLRLTVNGTDRAAQTVKGSVRITKPAEGPATAALTVFDFTPIEGQVIVIAVGAISNVLFAGHIVKVNTILPPSSGQSIVRYSLQCQDYSWTLNKQQVLTSYASDNVESILADLFSRYTSGFTTSHVNQGLGFITGPTPFTMETVDGCLRRLAQDVGAYYYIDAAKDLHFFAAGQDRSPQPHNLTTAYTDFERLAYSVDLSQIRTRIYVEGKGSTLTTAFNGGVSDIVVSDTSMFPDATIFNVRIGDYAPLGTRQLLVSKTSSTNLAPFAAGTDLAWADVIAMMPFPIGTSVQIWRLVEDTTAQTALAALDGSDGVRETYIQDRRLSYQGCLERGNAELERLANPIETVTYRTHDPCTKPGALVTVSVSSPVSVSGTFTIQEVVISDIETAVNRHPWYAVTATSTRRTLWDLLNATAQRAAIPPAA